MFRLFVALDLPEEIKERLADLTYAIPGARWKESEQLHLTLKFIGNVDGGSKQEIVDALDVIKLPGFELQLKGVGFFGRAKNPRNLWVGVDKNSALTKLQKRVERELTTVDIPADRKKFKPHITIATLKNAHSEKLADFLASQSLFTSEPFAVDAFYLYSSQLSSKGATYTKESGYPLATTERERLSWRLQTGF